MSTTIGTPARSRRARNPIVVKPVEPEPGDRPLRVLVASHSHPEISKGGAEIAAFELFRRIRDLPGHQAWFIGCQRDQGADRLGSCFTQPFSEREFIYSSHRFDWLKFANHDDAFPDEWRKLLARLAPEIVHFHHYINLGVEAFLGVREVLPDARIVVTLHEYLAICHHFGQMITKGRRNLCYESGPAPCNRCFPEISRTDFFLRKLYLERFFALVDHFIAPSAFLAERYVAWGLPRARVSVIENIVPPAAAPVVPEPYGMLSERDGPAPLRVGFFGQISALKGINVLLDVGRIYEDEKYYDVVFEVFGEYRNQPPDFQTEFLKSIERAGRNVRYIGPYEHPRLDRLMQSVDIVLVPSIWWENSPLVIQEALRNRRPVICSDIGGMAEKVRNGIDGFHFAAGDSLALAALLKRLAKDRLALSRVGAGLAIPAAPDDTVAEHLALYRRVLAAPPAPG